MTVPCHPLFSPLGVLKIRTPAYYRIHASLVESYRHAKGARLTKRQRARIRSRIFKQRGEKDG